MGLQYRQYLSSQKIYVCADCGTHLTTVDQVVSKNFTSTSGKAYLFDKVVNVTAGEPSDKMMRTGLHTVSDVHCEECHVVLGWTYVHAYQQSEKYKEGKFVLEKARLNTVLDQENFKFLKFERLLSGDIGQQRQRSMSPGKYHNPDNSLANGSSRVLNQLR